jgi:hypothetical protein
MFINRFIYISKQINQPHALSSAHRFFTFYFSIKNLFLPFQPHISYNLYYSAFFDSAYAKLYIKLFWINRYKYHNFDVVKLK